MTYSKILLDRSFLLLLACGVASASAGCVTSATTLQSARTLEPGDVRIATGVALPVSTRFFGEVADIIDLSTGALADAAATGRPVTVDEQREAIESVSAILLLQPSPVYELSARVGVAEHFDIGLRWAGPAFEIGGKYQFVDSPSFDLAGSLAYGYHTGIGASLLSSAFDLFESLKLVDYSRHDLNLGLLASGSREAILMPYGALRYLIGFASFDSELVNLAADSGAPATSTSVAIHHIGGTAGLRLGIPEIHVMVELTTMYMVFKPTILGAKVNLSGMLFTPAIGIGGEF